MKPRHGLIQILRYALLIPVIIFGVMTIAASGGGGGGDDGGDGPTSGQWYGTTGGGGGVYFQVSGGNVEDFSLDAYLSGGSGGIGWLNLAIGPEMSISGSSFSYSGSLFSVTGAFTGSSSANGTYDYQDALLGYSSGTWTASYSTDPYITISPTSYGFEEQMCGTTSDTVSFTLVNSRNGTATGTVSLSGTNADQFKIVSGGGGFSLTHNQEKDISVQFAPASTGVKTATLTIEGDSPCNDLSVSLTGTGTAPVLSVSPNNQMVQADSLSTSFTVSNEGEDSTTLYWTAEVYPSDTWLTITDGGSGTQTGTFTVSYDANNGLTRMGSISVRAEGASDSPQTITVVQAGNRFVKLTASDDATDDHFGYSAGICGDYVVVGAYGDDDNGDDSGAAYIFEMPSGGWIDMTETTKLAPSDGATDDMFGYSVGIYGDYVVVGAYGDDDKGDDSGSAYVFERTGDAWVQRAKLTPSDGAEDDMFGYSVGIYGDYVVVGAWGDDDNGYNSGSAYLFERPSGGWTDMNETAKLTASDGYGLYDDWAPSYDAFGHSVCINGDHVIVGAVGVRRVGSAYIFEQPTGGWVSMTETAKLTQEAYSLSSGNFGRSVSVSGDTAVVGADNTDVGNYSCGMAFIYQRPSEGWTDMTDPVTIRASDAGNWEENDFGFSVSISADSLIAGARLDEENGEGSGSAYIFEKLSDGWTNESEVKISPIDNTTGDYFGGSVGMSGEYAVIGAPLGEDEVTDSGSAYIYYNGNFSPDISSIDDVSIKENTTTNAIGFTVFDSETPPEDLIVTGTSSNTALVPNENIVFGGDYAHRTIAVTPSSNTHGSASITVTVSDGTFTASESFLLTVTE